MSHSPRSFSFHEDGLEKPHPFLMEPEGQLSLADFSTPLATISRPEMMSNIRSMAAWCSERNLSLAPHGKTTMAPDIWRLQLEAGAWAITVANASQLRVARAAGVPRVVIANEFIDPIALRWVYAELAADPDWQVVCWVDSLAGVAMMAAQHDGHSRPLDVCIELGNVRGGARSLALVREIARAVVETPALRLIGVAGYEGVIAASTEPSDFALVDDYLNRLLEAYLDLLPLYETAESIVSAGGSAYFDRVHSVLGSIASRRDNSHSTRVVLRSGVYVVHDDGQYERIAPQERGLGPRLVSAMKVWARVLSRPEPSLALLDAGCRDVSFDAGMPIPERVSRAGVWMPDELLHDASIVKLNDQHAYLKVEPASQIQVGDLVRLGLSHPCTTFDKWSVIPFIEDASSPNPAVSGFVRTHF